MRGVRLRYRPARVSHHSPGAPTLPTHASGAPGSGTGRRGFAGCLVAVLMGGAGFVLLLLGALPATREALPFGAALLALAVVAAAVSAWRLGRSAGPRDLPRDFAVAGAPVRPPTTVACPGCGGSAPIRVAEPTFATCPLCRSAFPLPADLVARLQHAAQLLGAQQASERQIVGSIERLARRQRGWIVRVTVMAVALAMVAAGAALFGWISRFERDDWHTWIAFGVTALVATVTLAALGLLVVPPWMKRILGRWTALRLPGVEGLACRECGGLLAAETAPVLRCGYCSADNVAGADVLVRLAADAATTAQGALAVAERRRYGDEVASVGLVAFPLLVLLAWFATGALAGTVLIGIGHDVELAPDSEARFAVVRAAPVGQPPRACLAAMNEAAGGTLLNLRAGHRALVSPKEMTEYRVQAPVAPAWLVGKFVHVSYGQRRVERVVRRLNFFASHVAETEDGTSVYLPWPDGGGELTCLTVDPGSGPAILVTP